MQSRVEIKKIRAAGEGECKSGGGGVGTDDGTGLEDSTSYLRRREVEVILRRKSKLCGGTRRASSRFRERVTQGRVKRKGLFGRHKAAGETVADIIVLCSCSASRYVMFRSNRRFKPGD